MVSKRPTIRDVAELAGVSIKTVSRVFNHAPHVQPGTRDRVMVAAETLSYRPNLSARQLASRRTFLIGMLYDAPNPENENDYVTVLQAGALAACREFGYHLLITPCRAEKVICSSRDSTWTSIVSNGRAGLAKVGNACPFGQEIPSRGLVTAG